MSNQVQPEFAPATRQAIRGHLQSLIALVEDEYDNLEILVEPDEDPHGRGLGIYDPRVVQATQHQAGRALKELTALGIDTDEGLQRFLETEADANPDKTDLMVRIWRYARKTV